MCISSAFAWTLKNSLDLLGKTASESNQLLRGPGHRLGVLKSSTPRLVNGVMEPKSTFHHLSSRLAAV
jgi:hypothetical protein